MLDAIPERLEFGAFQYGLPCLDGDTLVGVLDVELPGDLLQYVANRAKMGSQSRWQR